MILLLGCSSLSKMRNDHEHFYYQLQNYDKKFFGTIKASENSTWVLDTHKNNNQLFTPYDIMLFKEGGNQVLSYLSLGEAEEYRSYFKMISKNILLYENENWKGNYIIKYWSPEWHNIIYKQKDSLLNASISQGFDGVFLDVIDVYKRFDDQQFTAKAMADLVISISRTAKTKRLGFLINIQNGFDIVGDLSPESQNEFLNAVDGISIEAHFFNYSKKAIVKNPWFGELEKFIKRYQSLGKTIYMIEYVKDPKLIEEVQKYCRENEIKLLITSRALDGKTVRY